MLLKELFDEKVGTEVLKPPRMTKWGQRDQQVTLQSVPYGSNSIPHPLTNIRPQFLQGQMCVCVCTETEAPVQGK
jgi:hypothetical protein